MDQNEELKEELFAWSERLCAYSGEDERFLQTFWNKLLKNPEIYEEFAYYYRHRDFACKKKIEGVTIVDMLVWQMDHFKAWLDRSPEFRTNKDRMLLHAFTAFLDMAEKPQEVLARMQQETGTDYPGKV